MSSQLLLRHPLPPGERKVVELLPVMRRIAVREAVMVDKVRQRAEHIRTQLREEAEHRFHVHRASADSTRRRRSTSGAFWPHGSESFDVRRHALLGLRSCGEPSPGGSFGTSNHNHSSYGAGFAPGAGRAAGEASERAPG